MTLYYIDIFVYSTFFHYRHSEKQNLLDRSIYKKKEPLAYWYLLRGFRLIEIRSKILIQNFFFRFCTISMNIRAAWHCIIDSAIYNSEFSENQFNHHINFWKKFEKTFLYSIRSIQIDTFIISPSSKAYNSSVMLFYCMQYNTTFQYVVVGFFYAFLVRSSLDWSNNRINVNVCIYR